MACAAWSSVIIKTILGRFVSEFLSSSFSELLFLQEIKEILSRKKLKNRREILLENIKEDFGEQELMYKKYVILF
jgi:hypothetical protein